MKRVLVASVAVVMVVLMLAGCGGGSGNAEFAGTYKMTSIEATGMTVDIATIAETYGVDPEMLNIELKEDGTFEMTAFVGDGTESVSGTWKADGNNVTLTADGEDLPATMDGNKLTLDFSEGGQSMKMVFEK